MIDPGKRQLLLIIIVGLPLALSHGCIRASTKSGSAPQAPVILGSAQADLWICDNKPVAFEAAVKSDSPVTYEWTFSGGVTPLMSTNSIARVTTIGGDADYMATLKVRNQFGESLPQRFPFRVVACPDVTLQPIDSADGPPGPVRFQETLTGDVRSRRILLKAPAIELRADHSDGWTKANVGTYTTSFLRPDTGPIVGSIAVRRFRDWGAGDAAIIDRVQTEAAPGIQWQRVLELPRFAHRDATLAILDGKPAVAYVDDTRKTLKFAQSLVPDPASPDQWQISTLGAIHESAFHDFDLYWSHGRPIVLTNAWKNLVFVGNVATPGSEKEWTRIDLSTLTGRFINHASVMDSTGKLLLVVDQRDARSIFVIQAKTALPKSIESFVVSEPFASHPEWRFRESARLWQDHPIIQFEDDNNRHASFLRGSSRIPVADSDWHSFSTPDPIEPVDHFYPRLAVVGSRLWCTLFLPHGPYESNADDPLWYTTKENPHSASDWNAAASMQRKYVENGTNALSSLIDGRFFQVRNNGDTHLVAWREMQEDPTSSQDEYVIVLTPPADTSTKVRALQQQAWGNRSFLLLTQSAEEETFEVWSAIVDW